MGWFSSYDSCSTIYLAWFFTQYTYDYSNTTWTNRGIHINYIWLNDPCHYIKIPWLRLQSDNLGAPFWLKAVLTLRRSGWRGVNHIVIQRTFVCEVRSPWTWTVALDAPVLMIRFIDGGRSVCCSFEVGRRWTDASYKYITTPHLNEWVQGTPSELDCSNNAFSQH